jgi:hypothetical protein
MEDKDAPMMNAKQTCFKNHIIAYRHINHVAKDDEEGAYRKCLANSGSFPAISQEDFMKCSNNLFAQRVELMSSHVADEATKVFNIARS